MMKDKKKPCYIMQKQNQQVEVQVLQYHSNDTDILPPFCSLSSTHAHEENLLLFLNKLNSKSIKTEINLLFFPSFLPLNSANEGQRGPKS